MTSFLDIINEELDKQAAIKTKPKTKISLRDKPWISRVIKNSIKTKNQLYEHFFFKETNQSQRKLCITNSKHTEIT